MGVRIYTLDPLLKTGSPAHPIRRVDRDRYSDRRRIPLRRNAVSDARGLLDGLFDRPLQAFDLPVELSFATSTDIRLDHERDAGAERPDSLGRAFHDAEDLVPRTFDLCEHALPVAGGERPHGSACGSC